jgi:hypothetical protein
MPMIRTPVRRRARLELLGRRSHFATSFVAAYEPSHFGECL